MGIPYFDINAVEGDKDASVIISNPEGFLSDTGIKVSFPLVLINNYKTALKIVVISEMRPMHRFLRFKGVMQFMVC